MSAPPYAQVCQQCGNLADRVIYYGLPMHLCENAVCSCLFGFWSWIAEYLPSNDGGFVFTVYKGSYPRALWYWLRG